MPLLTLKKAFYNTVFGGDPIKKFFVFLGGAIATTNDIRGGLNKKGISHNAIILGDIAGAFRFKYR
jgi:hypothetical protein